MMGQTETVGGQRVGELVVVIFKPSMWWWYIFTPEQWEKDQHRERYAWTPLARDNAATRLGAIYTAKRRCKRIMDGDVHGREVWRFTRGPG